MLSITTITAHIMTKKNFLHIVPALCLMSSAVFLTACGGIGSTTRISPLDPPPVVVTPDPNVFTLTAQIPMAVTDAQLTIQVLGENKPIYQDLHFSGINYQLKTLSRSYSGKIVHIQIKANANSQIYDIFANQLVSFSGEINSIYVLMGENQKIDLTPASEAIYQRSLIRAGNLDLTNADLTLVESKHINQSTNEVYASLYGAFNTNQFPAFSTSQSSLQLTYNQAGEGNYLNVFKGLALLELWYQQTAHSDYPPTSSFMSLSQNLAVDLRDGYLDGRSIVGDKTAFIPFDLVKNTPKNVDPEHNTLLQIGELQSAVRNGFATALKTDAIDMANRFNQSFLLPEAYQKLQESNFIQVRDIVNNYQGQFRWIGAGDYRAAFGTKYPDSCKNGQDMIIPCRQGLNADDISAGAVSDVEYLIGTHQVGGCQVRFLPSGDVWLDQGTQHLRGSLNRDMSDNIQQINKEARHYILNVGSGELFSPYFLQFDVKDTVIVAARAGYAQSPTDIYPTSLAKTDITCTQ